MIQTTVMILKRVLRQEVQEGVHNRFKDCLEVASENTNAHNLTYENNLQKILCNM